VSQSWRSFEEVYLRLDRRVLGVFRILFSGVLLYDLLRRSPDAALLWSSDGVLSVASLRKAPQATPQVSFLLSLSSATSVQLAFAGLGVVFVLYGLGLFTRLMQVMALVGYASLNARNLFFEDGGTGTVILLLGWTLLLPLSDRFSLDALRRDAALPTLKQRVQARANARAPVVSLAALAVLLQAAVIYWLNAAHKTGQTWRGGDAVHLVLWQHRVNTPLAVWFASHEPMWFSPLSSWLTRRTEFVLPVLLLWPTQPKYTRSAAFVLAVMLHGGIALCMTLGPFSYAMICLLWLAVPAAAFDVLADFVRDSRRLRGWRVARHRARAVRALQRWSGRSAPRGQVPVVWRRRAAIAREVVLGWMLLVEAGSMLSSNRAVPSALRLRSRPWLAGYKPYLRGFQGWSMFAPDAPTDDGTMVVDAVTFDGRHIDPFTGKKPNWEQIRVTVAPHSIALSDYFFSMRDSRNVRYRRDLARYLKALPAESPAGRLRSAEFWWVSYVPPPRGSYVPGPIKKQLLWRTKL
jgi:Lipase maturation factor